MSAEEIFAENIRVVRKGLGFSQGEMNIKLGWEESRISIMEQGRGRVTIDEAIQFCEMFNIDFRKMTSQKAIVKITFE